MELFLGAILPWVCAFLESKREYLELWMGWDPGTLVEMHLGIGEYCLAIKDLLYKQQLHLDGIITPKGSYVSKLCFHIAKKMQNAKKKIVS
jgi:hypothetical protein